LLSEAGDLSSECDPASLHDEDVAANAIKIFENVRADDDCLAKSGEFLEDLSHFHTGTWVQSARGFIENEQLGIVNERFGEE
jgi:hypothetical protein